MIITAAPAETAGGLVRLTVNFDDQSNMVVAAFGSNLTQQTVVVTVDAPDGHTVGSASIPAGANMVPLSLPQGPIDAFGQFLFTFQ